MARKIQTDATATGAPAQTNYVDDDDLAIALAESMATRSAQGAQNGTVPGFVPQEDDRREDEDEDDDEDDLLGAIAASQAVHTTEERTCEPHPATTMMPPSPAE